MTKKSTIDQNFASFTKKSIINQTFNFDQIFRFFTNNFSAKSKIACAELAVKQQQMLRKTKRAKTKLMETAEGAALEDDEINLANIGDPATHNYISLLDS